MLQDTFLHVIPVRNIVPCRGRPFFKYLNSSYSGIHTKRDNPEVFLKNLIQLPRNMQESFLKHTLLTNVSREIVKLFRAAFHTISAFCYYNLRDRRQILRLILSKFK